MQEITKKNLNPERFGIVELRRIAVMAIKKCHYRYFLYLKKEEQDNAEVLLILLCYGEKKGVAEHLTKLFKSIC